MVLLANILQILSGFLVNVKISPVFKFYLLKLLIFLLNICSGEFARIHFEAIISLQYFFMKHLTYLEKIKRTLKFHSAYNIMIIAIMKIFTFNTETKSCSKPPRERANIDKLFESQLCSLECIKHVKNWQNILFSKNYFSFEVKKNSNIQTLE